MLRRSSAALALLALLVAGCGGGAATSTSVPASTQSSVHRSALSADIAGEPNLVTNPGFESGALAPGWTACGTVKTASRVVKTRAHTGTYSERNGSTAAPEVNGTAGICQTVTIPLGGVLTFWVYEGTTGTIAYVDQEADLLTTSGANITRLYSEAATTKGWVEKTFALTQYAGQTVQLYFGVKGNGYARGYVYQFVDDVQLTTGGSVPTPTPGGPTPTVNPCGPNPTCSGTPSPTPSPDSV